jgi:hypothetical protein
MGSVPALLVRFGKSASVPYGRFDRLLLTKEWSPLEQNVVERKYHARGIGSIRGVTGMNGSERSELSAIREEPSAST